VVGEGVDVFQGDVGAGGDDLGLPGRIGDGGLEEFEGLGARAGQDEPVVTVVGDAVLDILDTRIEDLEFTGGLVRFQIAGFGGDRRGNVQQEVGPAAGFGDPDGEALVRFVVDDCVLGGVRAKGVPEDFERALRFVQDVIENSAVVFGPGEAVGSVLDAVRQELAGSEVFEIEG